MNWGLLGAVTLTFLQLSLLAVGGANAVVPEIRHAVVVRHGWMNDETFAHLFAIAQSAPGPNITLVSLIGWKMVGLAGMLAATLAMLVPTAVLAFAAGRAWNRWEGLSWVSNLRQVLAPVAIGLLLASGVVLARTADKSAWALALTLAATALVVFSRRNPLWALVVGAAAAIALRRLGVAF
jgi:chromate transporter